MWETRSSDGWQLVRWLPKQLIDVEGVRIVSTEIHLSGQHWDPCELARTGDYVLVHHYECVFPCVVLHVKKLEALLHLLSNPKKLATGFELSLSPDSYQALRIEIGTRDDFVSSVEKPALTLRYDATRLHGEWVMSLDNSCIGDWATQLEAWMHQLE